MYTHPPSGVCNYATPANEALLDQFDSQVENYSTEDYQTPQVKKFCTDFLAKHSFPAELSFDPHDDINNESIHVKAYKCLRQGLRAFEFNGGHLERIEKPLGARDWILAQQILKEQQRIEEEGRREEILVSEIETDEEGRDSGDEGGNDDDDGFFLNLIAPL
jgi:hypothetical protein